MNFRKAFDLMKAGTKMKLPHWSGYWYWDPQRESIVMHTKEGEELDIRETVRVEYTLRNLLSDEWIAATADNCRELARK